MRTYHAVVWMLVSFCFSALAREQGYAIPRVENAPVYKNEIRKIFETPLFHAGPAERLSILQTGKQQLQISNNEGNSGWIEKKLVSVVAAGKTLYYEPLDILERLDRVEPIIIIDGTGPSQTPIMLERSFKDQVQNNVDKETIERQATLLP